MPFQFSKSADGKISLPEPIRDKMRSLLQVQIAQGSQGGLSRTRTRNVVKVLAVLYHFQLLNSIPESTLQKLFTYPEQTLGAVCAFSK